MSVLEGCRGGSLAPGLLAFFCIFFQFEQGREGSRLDPISVPVLDLNLPRMSLTRAFPLGLDNFRVAEWIRRLTFTVDLGYFDS